MEKNRNNVSYSKLKYYRSLYHKYKIDYFHLRNLDMFRGVHEMIKGGAPPSIDFENIYPIVIKYIMDYNYRSISTRKKNRDLFGSDSDDSDDDGDDVDDDHHAISEIAHVKGGASIKYHLNKKGIDTNGITNDIDILFFPASLDNTKDEVDRQVRVFYDELTHFCVGRIGDARFELVLSHDLYTIKLNGIHIIDITTYEPDFDIQDPSSMFGYALRQMGYSNLNDYYNKLKESDDNETLSFTSIEFELLSVDKGIQNVGNYIKSIPKWFQMKHIFQIKLDETRKHNPPDKDQISELAEIVKRYDRQLQPEYKTMLETKLKRYQDKKWKLESIISKKRKR